MKKTILLCALALICGAGLKAHQPSVLDRELFLGDPPKTVVLAKAVNAAAVGLPVPERPLTAGVFSYNAVLKVGGNEMKMKLNTEIKEEPGVVTLLLVFSFWWCCVWGLVEWLARREA